MWPKLPLDSKYFDFGHTKVKGQFIYYIFNRAYVENSWSNYRKMSHKLKGWKERKHWHFIYAKVKGGLQRVIIIIHKQKDFSVRHPTLRTEMKLLLLFLVKRVIKMYKLKYIFFLNWKNLKKHIYVFNRKTIARYRLNIFKYQSKTLLIAHSITDVSVGL